MLNVFIPHRWNNCDYEAITTLLDRTKFRIRDYSVPADDAFDEIDDRYTVDPQIRNQIKYASVVICSNRPANNEGMTFGEIMYALAIGKPVVAIQITTNSSQKLTSLDIPVVANRKDSIENWIKQNV